MEKEKRRRSRTDVIINILDEALSGANKTRLMYRCNLNFTRFNRYMQMLLDAGLIECVNANPEGAALYKTTDKGRELLKILRKANEFLSI
jgi:predicted transcriptional regulator